MSETQSSESKIVVYGSDECPYTKRVRAWLEDWKVDFRYVNVDKDEAAEALIASWNKGRSIRPSLDIEGEILINPERGALLTALRAHEVLPDAS